MARKIVSYQAHGDTVDGVLVTNLIAQLEDGSLVFTGINISAEGVSKSPEWHALPPVPDADEMD